MKTPGIIRVHGTTALTAAVFALVLAGCGEPEQPASEQDLGYEEPAGDVDVYRLESPEAEWDEEDVDVGAVEPDLGASEETPPRSESADTADFAAMDTNGDDAIAQDEWIAGAVPNTEFSAADADGDGTVNQEEFREAVGATASGDGRSMTEFAALDTNSDGTLAEDEWNSEVLDARFSEVDEDGDQTVNREEFRNALSARNM